MQNDVIDLEESARELASLVSKKDLEAALMDPTVIGLPEPMILARALSLLSNEEPLAGCSARREL